MKLKFKTFFCLATFITIFATSAYCQEKYFRLLAPPVITGKRKFIDKEKSKQPIAKIRLRDLEKTSLVLSAPEQDRKAILLTRLGHEFRVFRQDNFYLASDVNASEIKSLVLKTLKICKRNLQQSFFKTPIDIPVVIYAFRNAKSYRQNLKRLWHEKPISPYGHYNYVRRHIIFNYNTGLGTLIHELTHALMDVDMPQAPIWFAEGLASLYEQCIIEGKDIHGASNWRLTQLHHIIGTAKYTPLAKLFQLNDREFKKQESGNYAQARYFCMYLEYNNLLRKFYQLFRDNFQHDSSGKIFVEKLFKSNLAGIETAWLAWVKRQSWTNTPTLPKR